MSHENNKNYFSHFVLGGARSGKSAFAEKLVTMRAQSKAKRKVYIATAEAFDDEMKERIAQHIVQRGNSWTTVQEPLDIVGELKKLNDGDVALVDCLTIWANNLIYYEKDADESINELCAFLANPSCDVVLVSNELGLGLVPMDKISRQFRDISGKMNQAVACQAKTVSFVAAGLPITLKDDVT